MEEERQAAKEKIVADLLAFDGYHRKGNPFAIRKQFSVEDVCIIDDIETHGDLATTAFFHVPYMTESFLLTTDADIDITFESTSDDSNTDTRSATPQTQQQTRPLFYRRNDVSALWAAIDSLEIGKTLWVRGQPGTGKSTGIWKKLLMLAKADDNLHVLWTSLDRNGNPLPAMYFQGRCFHKVELTRQQIGIFLAAAANGVLPLNLVVVDGINQAVSSDLVGEVDEWIRNNPTTRKAIFSSSSKLEELRSHQNDSSRYLTVQSWTLEEFQSACIESQGGKLVLTPFCQQITNALKEFYPDDDTVATEVESTSDDASSMSEDEKDVDDANMSGTDNDDLAAVEQQDLVDLSDAHKIKAAIKGKFRWSGGSARWMFNYSRGRIEAKLRTYCRNAKNRKALLDGHIGPTSEASTNYFFGSSLRDDNETEYFLVSQEAVRILSESIDRTSFEFLYSVADQLDNPSFVGWIVEADFFFQLGMAIKHKSTFRPPFESDIQPALLLAYDHTKCRSLLLAAQARSYRKKIRQKKLDRIKSIAGSFVPDSKGKTIACKPVRWNQGGYDLFFVELAPHKAESARSIDIRFVQVTKGVKHDLKAGYLYAVVKFFEEAGYTINEVEIAFILTAINCVDFSVEGVEAKNALKEYRVYGGNGAKWATISDSTVQKYILTLSKTDFSP